MEGQTCKVLECGRWCPSRLTPLYNYRRPRHGPRNQNQEHKQTTPPSARPRTKNINKQRRPPRDRGANCSHQPGHCALQPRSTTHVRNHTHWPAACCGANGTRKHASCGASCGAVRVVCHVRGAQRALLPACSSTAHRMNIDTAACLVACCDGGGSGFTARDETRGNVRHKHHSARHHARAGV